MDLGGDEVVVLVDDGVGGARLDPEEEDDGRRATKLSLKRSLAWRYIRIPCYFGGRTNNINYVTLNW